VFFQSQHAVFLGRWNIDSIFLFDKKLNFSRGKDFTSVFSVISLVLNTGYTLKSPGKHVKKPILGPIPKILILKVPDDSCIQG